MKFEKSMLELNAEAGRNLARIQQEDERDARMRKHNWAVSIFGVVGGAIAGGIVSTAFWIFQVLVEL